MRTADLIRFARDAATGNRLRTSLLVLAMAIGVAAVVVLTALGDGARRYVVDEFASLGKMEEMGRAITTVRSSGAHLMLIVQSLPNLREIYGPRRAGNWRSYPGWKRRTAT